MRNKVAHQIFLLRPMILFLFCFFICPVLAFGTPPDTVRDWDAVCKEAEKTPFPPKDRPNPEEAKKLQNCSSRDFYYGFDKPADPVLARKCAYREMDDGDDLVFGGSSILMMIYANGKGVEQNLDLAIKFACRLDMVGAMEDKDRVMHLARLKKEKWRGNNFSLCDDISSGFMQGHCSEIEYLFAKARQGKKLAGLTSRWNEKDKSAFTILEDAFNDFVRARMRNEVDLSGTARSVFMNNEMSSLREDFLSDLERFERGELPRFTPVQFKKADRELNSVYQRIQEAKDFEWGTITNEGIKTTQRAWLKYRDAWVTFGLRKYPTVSPDAWKTWLTRKRIKMLKEFIEK